jgi:uncharacterized protein (TIGR04551 family)
MPAQTAFASHASPVSRLLRGVITCLPALGLTLAVPSLAQDKEAEKKAPAEAKAEDKKAADGKEAQKTAEDKKAKDKKAEEKAPADAKAAGAEGDKKPEGDASGGATGDAPPLPGDAESPATTDTPAPPATGTSPADLERLKTQLKEELAAELKEEMQADLQAAAEDAAAAQASAAEWEEEKWVEEVEPKLNFLEFDGYFRTRGDFFHQLDLGTYDPIARRGTSPFPTPTLYRPYDGDEELCVDGHDPGGGPCQVDARDTSSITTMNMRLRLDPTLNVSEDIRVRTTLDVMDNVVFGSTPEAKPGFANNPSLPLPLFAANVLTPQQGFNAMSDAIMVKRLWAEVMTPFGQLRFGRLPQHFGLGLLANHGNGIDNDFGDNSDLIGFATRLFGHYIVPQYSLTSSGANGRGGGAGDAGDFGQAFYQGEGGQRYNLDPRDDVHSFILAVAKKDKEEDIKLRVRNGDWVLNYGTFLVYRTQAYDIPAWYGSPNPTTTAIPDDYVRRNANALVGSGWGRFQWDTLRVEAEVVGIAGKIDYTSTTSEGLDAYDGDLGLDPDNEGEPLPLWISQVGYAVESRYGFLNDSLVVGLDHGFASGDDAPGFGIRPVIKQQPLKGDVDGKQYGGCLAADEDGNCTEVDNNVTNYKFDPGYNIDLILFREILGTVTDAFYFKPHVAYFLTEDIGVRADLISSFAMYASSTPGNANPLGVELDLSGFYRSDDGFYLMAQYGFLFPLAGLHHGIDEESGDYIGGVDPRFGEAQPAQTFQLFFGTIF